MNSLETAVIKTLAYSDMFNQALTTTELQTFLIEYKVKKPITLLKISSTTVQEQNGIFYMSGRQELAKLKSSQLHITNDKLKATQKYLWIFKLIPWIRLVGITGSVAAKSPKANDDIDILVIAAKNRLWLSRLCLTLMLNLIDKRRKPQDNPDKVNNKFCLNMWLSEDDLVETNQDLYTANELARIWPVLNRGYAYQKYIQSNLWAATYLPNFFNASDFNYSSASSYGYFINILSPILSNLNYIAELLQKRIMRRPTIELIESNRLAFHPRDYRSEILKQYKKKLRALSISE